MVATGQKWAMMHGNMDFEFQKENVALSEQGKWRPIFAGVARKPEQARQWLISMVFSVMAGFVPAITWFGLRGITGHYGDVLLNPLCAALFRLRG